MSWAHEPELEHSVLVRRAAADLGWLLGLGHRERERQGFGGAAKVQPAWAFRAGFGRAGRAPAGKGGPGLGLSWAALR